MVSPGSTSSVAVDANAMPQGSSPEPNSYSYECMLCGTHWGYADIHNTARCPACGGGLVRDLIDPASR